MRTVLLAADNRFWLADRGSRVRVDALVSYLFDHPEFDVALFDVSTSSQHERDLLRARHPELAVFHRRPRIDGRPQSYMGRAFRKLRGLLSSAKKRLVRGLASMSRSEQPALSAAGPRICDFTDRQVAAQFAHIVATLKPDVIIIEFLRLAYLTEALAANERERVKLCLDTHDVMHERCQAFAAQGVRHWVSITRQEEVRILRQFDVVMAIQPKDRSTFESLDAALHVITVPHPFQVSSARGASRTSTSTNVSVHFLFVGSSALPNRVGITEFIRQCWPHLSERHSDRIRLDVVGGVCESLSDLDLGHNVHLHGFVEDVDSFYASADIVVNPVLFGGGLKIKSVQALCHGLPLVTTSAGAAGMESGLGDAFLVYDSYPEMTARLSALIDDPVERKRLGQAAVDFANLHFAPDVAYRSLVTELQH